MPLTTLRASNLDPSNSVNFRNRIINGDMRIDQRNAGASVTPSTSGYSLDRWRAGITVASKFSLQQNAGSVTPPSGFTNYLGATSLSAYSVGSGDILSIQQHIEGYNVADFNWGTATAKTVTLSFWVRSSLTGTFGGALSSYDGARSYPYSYTVSSANTWTQISVTIPGDQTGDWLKTNGLGIQCRWGLGVGSTYSGTAGSWSANNYFAPTGATSVVGTSGATFYITGVQLEAGTAATAFEYRPYGTEFTLCQRYFETSYNYGIAIGASSSPSYTRWSNNGTANAMEKIFKVAKRTTPSIGTYDTSGNAGKIRIFDSTTDPANITPTAASANMNSMFVTYNSTANGMQFQYAADAEL